MDREKAAALPHRLHTAPNRLVVLDGFHRLLKASVQRRQKTDGMVLLSRLELESGRAPE